MRQTQRVCDQEAAAASSGWGGWKEWRLEFGAELNFLGCSFVRNACVYPCSHTCGRCSDAPSSDVREIDEQVQFGVQQV